MLRLRENRFASPSAVAGPRLSGCFRAPGRNRSVTPLPATRSRSRWHVSSGCGPLGTLAAQAAVEVFVSGTIGRMPSMQIQCAWVPVDGTPEVVRRSSLPGGISEESYRTARFGCRPSGVRRRGRHRRTAATGASGRRLHSRLDHLEILTSRRVRAGGSFST